MKEESKMEKRKITRRKFLKFVGVGATGLAGAKLVGCAPAATPAPTAAPMPTAAAPTVTTAPAVVTKPKIAIWMENGLVPEIDQLHEAVFKEWGTKNNVEVEFLAVSITVLAEKLTAAVEGGNPPAIAHLQQSRLFSWQGKGQLLSVKDVVEKLAKKGGGIIPSAPALAAAGGDYWGVPYALDAVVMHTRQDLLDKAGLKYPATWDEFYETSKKLTQPPGLYGWGMPMGHDPDTDNSLLPVLWGYGGKYTNDDGSLAFRSDAMVKAIQYVAKMYKEKIIPPGATGWDGAGNNKAYQSRQLAFTYNTLSVYSWCTTNDPELATATTLHGAPAGPLGAFDTSAGYGLSIFKGTKYVDEAKSALEYFFEPDRYWKVIQIAKGRYMPIYKDLLYNDFYLKDPVYAGIPKMMETARFHSYSGPFTAAVGELEQTFVVPDMLGRVVVDGWEPEKAMDEAYDKATKIWTKYGLKIG
jgi:multiple sugar transport system substrate-binding protein